MPNMNVTYDQMRDGARRLRDAKAQIDDKLREAKGQIDQLVTEGYVTDRSSKVFNDNYQEFDQAATKTNESLDGMSSYLDQAADAIQRTDEELASAQK